MPAPPSCCHSKLSILGRSSLHSYASMGHCKIFAIISISRNGHRMANGRRRRVLSCANREYKTNDSSVGGAVVVSSASRRFASVISHNAVWRFTFGNVAVAPPPRRLLVQIYRANFFSDVSIEHAHYIVPAPIRRDPHNSKANKLHDTCSPVAIRAVFWESLTVKPRILTASCLIDLALLRNAHVVAAAAASDAINSLVNMRKYFANEWF